MPNHPRLPARGHCKLFVETRTIAYNSERGYAGVECFTVAEVMVLLGISNNGVYELARRRSLPVYCHHGKAALFARGDVEAAMAKRGLL